MGSQVGAHNTNRLHFMLQPGTERKATPKRPLPSNRVEEHLAQLRGQEGAGSEILTCTEEHLRECLNP